MLTILSVAYPLAPVTRDPAGGAEQVLAAIDRALVTAGHRSIVIAQDGSDVAGTLLPLPRPAGTIDDAFRRHVRSSLRSTMASALTEHAPDLVHLQGLDFADYLPPPGTPVLATLHLPLDWYPPDALRPARPRTTLQPVSADQAAQAPEDVRLAAPIANGVDVDLYRPAPKADYVLVLGRVAPEKGFHDALDGARRAGVRLRAAGTVFPHADHQRYFTEQIVPRLDADRIWLGPAHGAAKRRLLAEARCVLIPSTARETSSLVAMEALASGTPVIAYRAGALPDIVEHGVTGLIVDDADGMADALGRIGEIDPAACRAHACARFPLARTTAAYLDLYHRLTA